jgi:hypothetical protein
MLQVNPFSKQIPIVEKDGSPTNRTVAFSQAVALLPTIMGTGSPENVVSSPAPRFYIDLNGAVGAKLYIKPLDHIGGDTKQGWELA